MREVLLHEERSINARLSVIEQQVAYAKAQTLLQAVQGILRSFVNKRKFFNLYGALKRLRILKTNHGKGYACQEPLGPSGPRGFHARGSMKVIILLLCWISLPADATPVITGIIEAINEAQLSMAVSGRVEAIMVKEGEQVKPGKLLLHLDRTLEQLDVRRRKLLVKDIAHLDELRQR